MRPRTNRQELEAARRHTGRVEAQLRQANKRIAELEAERDAPTMHAAIEETLADLEAIYGGGGFDRHDADRAIERLRAALRKAKGEGGDD